MNIKKTIKKTFIGNIIQKARRKAEYNQIMNINNEYKEVINRLLDGEYLDTKIRELDGKAKECDKVFYVIAQENTKVGIFGYINCFLPHIAYAVAKGYIPVIDMQTYDNIYIPKDQKGKEFNSWESFFQQPMGYGIKDIGEGSVIHCPSYLWYRWMPNSCPLMSDKEIKMWSVLYKRYIRFSNIAKEYIENEEKEILLSPEKTIGVIYRGTTYTKGQATGHPIQPTMKMLGNKIEEVLEDTKSEFVYVASDEKSIVNYLKKRFPGRVIINKRVYYDETNVDYSKYNIDGTDIVGDMFDRMNNEYLIGIEYISSINLVSKCKYFIGGACGGTTAVLYLNALRFDYRYIFELGKYGTDPIPED